MKPKLHPKIKSIKAWAVIQECELYQGSWYEPIYIFHDKSLAKHSVWWDEKGFKFIKVKITPL